MVGREIGLVDELDRASEGLGESFFDELILGDPFDVFGKAIHEPEENLTSTVLVTRGQRVDKSLEGGVLDSDLDISDASGIRDLLEGFIDLGLILGGLEKRGDIDSDRILMEKIEPRQRS